MTADETTGADAARLAPIGEADPATIEALLDLAFGADRHGRTAYRLRAGVAPELAASCAAFGAGGELVGSLQTWPLGLSGAGGAITPLWLVGPIAVHPRRRDEGIGRAMLNRALAAIDGTAIPALLIGDPGYYGPFGFTAKRTGGWTLPGPIERHRLLLRVDDGVAVPASGMLGPRR